MIKILVDCFGGDHSPQAPVAGALAALAKNPDLHLILTGDEAVLKKELEGKSEWEKALSDLKAENAKREKEWEQKMQGILDANKTSEQTIADLKKQLSDRDAAEAARVRMDGIIKQAKELGVPQSMIDLGLNIPADWDADKTTNYLTAMANNWKTSHLPNDKQNPLANIGEPKKEDVDAIAAELVR